MKILELTNHDGMPIIVNADQIFFFTECNQEWIAKYKLNIEAKTVISFGNKHNVTIQQDIWRMIYMLKDFVVLNKMEGGIICINNKKINTIIPCNDEIREHFDIPGQYSPNTIVQLCDYELVGISVTYEMVLEELAKSKDNAL
jgi:hypothetical protein